MSADMPPNNAALVSKDDIRTDRFGIIGAWNTLRCIKKSIFGDKFSKKYTHRLHEEVKRAELFPPI